MNLVQRLRKGILLDESTKEIYEFYRNSYAEGKRVTIGGESYLIASLSIEGGFGKPRFSADLCRTVEIDGYDMSGSDFGIGPLLGHLTDPALNINDDGAYLYGKPKGIKCPYCDTFGIEPVKPLVPGAPKTCPHCGGWL